MQHREVAIVNKLGLNAPTSTKLTQLAAKYQCDVSLARSGRKVNAQSLTGVMMLAAGKGSRVVLETNGQDDMEALSAIVALIRDYFGEGDDAKQLSSDHRRPVTWPNCSNKQFSNLAIAFGTILFGAATSFTDGHPKCVGGQTDCSHTLYNVLA